MAFNELLIISVMSRGISPPVEPDVPVLSPIGLDCILSAPVP
ncbi:MAG: hypothetical protein ABWK15_01675 [Dissulfuribacterales bacterium]